MNPAPVRAFLLAIGDELLLGAHPDLNSPEIARRLAENGIVCCGVSVVRDQEEELVLEMRRALERAEVVIVTGGLGPTLDDVTRHAAAEALGRPLVEDPQALAQVEAWYAQRGGPMPAANRRQALMPEGAHVVPNRVGTAPGFRAETEGKVLFALPGPPREMSFVLEEEVLPWLDSAGLGHERPARSFHLYGLPESRFAELVGDWMARDADPRMGCSVKRGILSVSLRAVEMEGAAERLTARIEGFRERFADWLFSEDEPRLEAVLVRELEARGRSLTLAESCTGGLAASLLTAIPGASDVFPEGFVTYSNAAKVRTLGVPEPLLAERGAVSAEVAEAMAQGARSRASADLAVAVTGIAGPDGGSREKPVGLVWFGLAWEGGVHSFERRFPAVGRERVQGFAARGALFAALSHLRERLVV